MEVKIVWTPQAVLGFERIISYLETHFSEKEIKNLSSILKYGQLV